MTQTREHLVDKLKVLTETLWLGAADWPKILDWLNNFAPDPAAGAAERLHALFLLSQFMYFGSREVRELLRSLYRDAYRYPIIEHLRRSNDDLKDSGILNKLFAAELERTRFLGIGNPSESGTHLLYYFRQENDLKRELFINTHDIFTRIGASRTLTLRAPAVTRYVFLDDFCGSGTQAVRYSESVLEDLQRANRSARTSYYALVATTSGLQYARANSAFHDVAAVMELDESFRCFGDKSRYFRAPTPELDSRFAESMCRAYGERLFADWPLGYGDCQLLIGFFHNVPDNTLPIIWGPAHRDGGVWVPIFRRYPKLNDWGGV